MFAIIKIHLDVAWKDGTGMDPLFTLKGQRQSLCSKRWWIDAHHTIPWLV